MSNRWRGYYMAKWEYQVLRTGIQLHFKELWTTKIKGNRTGWDLVQEMGRDGWELVSAFPVESAESGTNAVGWVFKRPLPEDADASRPVSRPIDLD
jgi:hypothetical protein